MDLFDIAAAAEAGQQAAEACAASAERQGWDREAAAAFLLDWLARHGPTPGEVLVSEASRLHPPHDGRAFGAVFLRLKRQGLIVDCGHARRAKGHNTHGGLIWRLVEE